MKASVSQKLYEIENRLIRIETNLSNHLEHHKIFLPAIISLVNLGFLLLQNYFLR